LGGSLLSYIYSAPPLKVVLLKISWFFYLVALMFIWLSSTYFLAKTKWMDWKLCPWSKLHQFAMVWYLLLW
jgi:hypothetical protein